MNRAALAALTLASALALAACPHGTITRTPTESPQEDTSLGPGDVFEVRVFGEAGLTGKYQVGNDGTFRYPFLGTVQVGGKQVDEVSQEIARGLKEGQFLLDPQVNVYVEQANSRRISVIGAVSRPGTFPITPGMTVVQAVSNAGGFTPLASKDDTVVTRRVNGKLERYRLAVSEVTRGNSEDLVLRAGDLIFVPERVF